MWLGSVGSQSVSNQTDIAIGGAGKPIRVFSAHVLSGGTAATVSLRNGTSASATVFVQIDGVISKGATLTFPEGLLFPAGCFADVDANTVDLTVAFVLEA